MTILEKLSLSEKTRAAMLASPEAKLRGKMLEGLDLQMEAAKASEARIACVARERPSVILNDRWYESRRRLRGMPGSG